MAGERKAIGKSTRFRIFARDGYTCRYCGGTPPQVVLVIDHLHPVAEGGGNDDANLITACRDCNAGKGKKLLGTVAPTEEDGRRIAQEYAEQIDLAAMAAEAARTRMVMRDAMSDYWASLTGLPPTPSLLTLICNLVEEFGHEVVIPWMEATANKRLDQQNAAKYLSGIARNSRPKPNVDYGLGLRTAYAEALLSANYIIDALEHRGISCTLPVLVGAAFDCLDESRATTIDEFEDTVANAARLRLTSTNGGEAK